MTCANAPPSSATPSTTPPCRPEVVEAIARHPPHPQVHHRASPGRRPAVVLGGLQRGRGLLPRHLHPRLELRPGRRRTSSPTWNARCAKRNSASARTSAGHQSFRSPLPIAPDTHPFYAAADGQLGGIMKVYRDWRVSGDTEWLRGLWPQVRQSLLYCIETWDPDHQGLVSEPHHNTYDIEFWGPDGHVHQLLPRRPGRGHAHGRGARGGGRAVPQPRHAERASNWKRRSSTASTSTSARSGPACARAIRSNPRGRAWSAGTPPRRSTCSRRRAPSTRSETAASPMASSAPGWRRSAASARRSIPRKVLSHLRSVHRYNFQKDLWTHANPARPEYAVGHEGGVLLCTWPHGDEPTLPMPYS